MLRTKYQSLKRLRSLSREQLHELSEEFTITERKPLNWLKIGLFAIPIIYTITVILISRI